MRCLLENPLWHRAKANRSQQRLAGLISGFCLTIALVALVDGLIAQMRKGNNNLDLLPGATLALSGPTGVKNPVHSDLQARFLPADAPLSFILEGYFTGYWLGNGMWRGQIRAAETAAPGDYELRISFRGAGSRGAQHYVIHIFSDEDSLKAASHSFIYRALALNPFILAAICAGPGIIAGAITYFFGRRYYSALHSLGLAEIYFTDPRQNLIWCLAPRELAPKPGNARIIIDCNGHVFGEARAEIWEKGKLRLSIMDERKIPPGALVCLKHPGANSQ